MKIKTLLLTLVMLACLAFDTMAQRDTTHHFTVGAGAMYGYNYTLSHYGGADLTFAYTGFKYFEGTAAFEYHSPDYAMLGIVATPVLPLKHGALFADAAVHSAFACRNQIANLTVALSVGYRMDYLNLQVGAMTHWFMDMKSQSKVWEPLHVLYRIGVEARPRACKWNIGVGAANFNEFEYERAYNPIYNVNARVTVWKKMQWHARVEFKPSSPWNLTAKFWGVMARTGISYTF